MEVLRKTVEFTEEWMGNPKGSKKLILTNWANELVKRGQAAFVKEEEKKEDIIEDNKEEIKEIQEKSNKEVEEKEESKIKMMGKVVKDKMFKGNKNK